jgi:hypothetical protein
MSKLYVQNKSEHGEIIQFVGLDGVTVMGTLTPGQFFLIETKDGKMLTPMIVREVKTQG